MRDFKTAAIAYLIFICSILGFSNTKSFSYSNRTLDYRQYTLPDLNVYLPYKWHQKGVQVVNLQQTLNMEVTGIYDEQTHSYHYAYLKFIGVPTTNIPQIPQEQPLSVTATINNTTTDTLLCGPAAAREFAHKILDHHAIQIPVIVSIANTKSSFYGPGGTAIYMPPCETKSGIAHEIGHYVYAKAFGFNWDMVVKDAEIHFTGNDWIVAQETTPGIEHSAHCIGYVLWQRSAYTKCPDSTMRSYATKIIAQAG